MKDRTANVTSNGDLVGAIFSDGVVRIWRKHPPRSRAQSPSNVPHEVRPDVRLCATQERARRLIFQLRYCGLRSTPPHAYIKASSNLLRELPKKRRRTEVSVPYSGSGSAIGWHNNTLKIDLCSCTRMRSAPRSARPRAACGARPSHRKTKVMEVRELVPKRWVA